MKIGNSSKLTLLAVLIFALSIISAVNFGAVRDVAGQSSGGGSVGIDDDDDNNGGGPKNNPPSGGGGPVTYVTYELCGYAWGGVDEGGSSDADGGVGWVSFNSRNTGNSGASYSVYAERDPSSSRIARLKGYAWSSNIGWIKFGDLQEDGSGQDKIGNDGSTNCIGSDEVDCGNARIVFANPVNFGSGSFAGSGLMQGQNSQFRGWLRACAGTINGDCSSPQSRTDGWDGWISLSPGLSGGQLTTNASYAFGYGWGSNVVGWLSLGPPTTPGGLGDTVYFCDGDASFNFSVSGGSIQLPPGGSGSVNVNVGLVSGSPSSVTLSKTDPSGITSSFAGGSNPSCTPTCAAQPLNITVGSGVAEGNYTIRVTGTSGSGPGAIVRNADILVTVANSGPPASTLSVSCQAPAVDDINNGPVLGGNRFYVNRPVTWRVVVNSNPAPVSPFSYRPIYGGVPGTVVSGVGSTTYNFTRTYTTIGVKTFSAEVTDSAVPTGAQGTCSNTSAIVIVNPDFNEK